MKKRYLAPKRAKTPLRELFNYILVTNNQKHFEKIENIQVVNWAT